MSPMWSGSGELRYFYVYVLSNPSMSMYIGVTNDLAKRFAQHQEGENPSFTSRYHFDRIVHFESFPDIREAIAREKELKGWTRPKKIALVKQQNPEWRHLL